MNKEKLIKWLNNYEIEFKDCNKMVSPIIETDYLKNIIENGEFD